MLVQVGHRNARRQGGEIWVLLRHVGAGLCRQGIDLRRADAVVEAWPPKGWGGNQSWLPAGNLSHGRISESPSPQVIPLVVV